MTSKDTAIRSTQKLPDSLTWADIFEDRIRFLSTIDIDINNIKSDNLIPHDNLKETPKQSLSE